MLVILMGVTGAGKTVVGRQLAATSGAAFYDADDYHSPSAIAKMAKGEPLTDTDREPWLERLAQLIAQSARRDQNAVLACSALKATYRSQLLAAARDAGIEAQFVHLRVTPEVAAARLNERRGHYMPVRLVESQFSTLEDPEDAIAVDATAAPEFLVEQICGALEARRKH